MLIEEKLLNSLQAKKLTLSLAESCTGGLLAHRVTNIPGSSKTFLLGITAYANSAKCRLLKIPEKTIQNYGAVSRPTARLMAEGARRLGGSDLGAGLTGIAGPAGASKDKPVGTVFIAVSSSRKTLVKKFHFRGSRLRIKKQAADKAIQMLLEAIK
ncbi:MAG TPA: CinA family protein [Candidatus Omnitrophota bacterium]|nr:CinA family protein [Candidatus Omnitrophota bacterium]